MARLGDAAIRHKRALWIIAIIAIWLVTRALMVSELGYWRLGTKVNYQDVNVFHDWATRIATTHAVPAEASWQYPPGAIVAFLLPRAVPGHYGAAFVGLVLAVDLVTMLVLTKLCLREGNRTDGVWLWLLAIPVLGGLPLLRFDLIPTCIAVVALVLVTSSRRLFGFVVGVGIAVKAWPALVLVAVNDRRRALAATITAGATMATAMIVSRLTLHNAFGFLHHQSGRGLELEAIAASPWYLYQAVTGHGVHWVARNGTNEIFGGKADLTARVLQIALFLLAAAVIAWWIASIRRGSVDIALGRDSAFTAVLLFVVVSAVLSPQYIVWLIGMGAVAITSPACRVRRPVAMVAVAAVLTRALLASWGDLVSNGANGAYLLCLRNLLLVVAAVDAAAIMWRALRSAGADSHSSDSAASIPSFADR